MKPALVIVDMQRYYLEEKADFYRYYQNMMPGSMDYIRNRADKTVIPNIKLLLDTFRKKELTVVFLRLCGLHPEREDLHVFFKEAWEAGKKAGYPELYPLADDPFSEVIRELSPEREEREFIKQTFSAFTSSAFEDWLLQEGIDTLVMSGLATSQCVETTARDASDRSYQVIQVEDAQADYDQKTHDASLHSSRGVCGGMVVGTQQVADFFVNWSSLPKPDSREHR